MVNMERHSLLFLVYSSVVCLCSLTKIFKAAFLQYCKKIFACLCFVLFIDVSLFLKDFYK